VIDVSSAANGRLPRFPAIRLTELPDIAHADLGLSVHVEQTRLVAYSVVVAARLMAGGAWSARIDLDPPLLDDPDVDEAEVEDALMTSRARRGRGPCTHPQLHCHLGWEDSVLDTPEARVPLPWLAPHEALEWLVAAVQPGLEPCDWR